MPMQRWMQSAAGGTSQRLKPALAMMRSRSRSPAAEPTSPPACSIVVMAFPLSGAPPVGRAPLIWQPSGTSFLVLLLDVPGFRHLNGLAQDAEPVMIHI